jgi:hypothetical protein
MDTREEAIEVAKLAAMVGGQMKMVDKMTVERTSNQANRIDIQEFINKVKNPNASFPVHLPQTPAGFAPPVSEAYIQSMVPDAQPTYNPQPDLQPLNITPAPVLIPAPAPISEPQLPVGSINLPHIVKPEQEAPKMQFREDIKPLLTRSDIDSIRNSLKGIDKTLAGMLTLLKNSKLTSNE